MSMLLIRDARPVDASSAACGEPVDVWLDGDSILDVRPAGSPRRWPSRRRAPAVVDAAGRWLTQSLVDSHVHLEGVGSDAVGWPRARALDAFQTAGVTVLRDLTPYPIRPRASRHGIRTVMANAHPDHSSDGWVKAYGLSVDELRALMGRARAGGARVAAHLAANTAASLLDAFPLPDSIEHVYTLLDYDFVSDVERDRAGVHPDDRGIATWALAPGGRDLRLQRLIGRLGRERAFVVPTLAVMSGMLGPRPGRPPALPPRVEEWWRQRAAGFGWEQGLTPGRRRVRQAALAGLLRLAGRLMTAGSRLVVGTDFGEPFIRPGHGVHVELSRLTDAGLGPGELLRAAVLHPRQLLGQATGIRPGADADLLLLDRDPLRDATALMTPWVVVAGGEVFTRDEAARGRRASIGARG